MCTMIHTATKKKENLTTFVSGAKTSYLFRLTRGRCMPTVETYEYSVGQPYLHRKEPAWKEVEKKRFVCHGHLAHKRYNNSDQQP